MSCVCGHASAGGPESEGRCVHCLYGTEGHLCPGSPTFTAVGGGLPPRVASRPPVGIEVTVSSTRRDKDGVGRVVTCDDIGIRVRLNESDRDRFYPWGQVAYVEWYDAAPTPVETVPEPAPAEPAAPVLTAVAPAPEPEADPQAEALAQWAPLAIAQLGMDVIQINEWWARRLSAGGFPVESYVVKPAVYRNIVEGNGALDGGVYVDADGAFGADDEENFLRQVTGVAGPKVKGRILTEKEVRGARIPMALYECNHPSLAFWVACNHAPAEVDALYRLHEGDFALFMDRLRAEAAGESRPDDDA